MNIGNFNFFNSMRAAIKQENIVKAEQEEVKAEEVTTEEQNENADNNIQANVSSANVIKYEKIPNNVFLQNINFVSTKREIKESQISDSVINDALKSNQEGLKSELSEMESNEISAEYNKFELNESEKTESTEETVNIANNNAEEIDSPEEKLNQLKTELKNSILDQNQNNSNVFEPLRYNYSEDFIDNIFKFIENNMMQDSSEINDETLNLFRENFYKLTGETDLHYYQASGFQIGPKTDVRDIFEGGFSQNGLLSKLDTLSNSSDIQVSYFANIFKSVFEEHNMTDSEQVAFMNMIFKDMNVQNGEFANFDMNLDKNADKCWLEELYTIVHNRADQIVDADKNANTIDTSVLFKDTNVIDAQYIIDNLDELMLSEDGGVRKFASIINDTIQNFNIFNNYDREELVMDIIRTINDKYCKNPIADFRCLSQSVVDKLNNNDVFTELKNIIESEEFHNMVTVSGDGLLGGFGQSSTGDCWLLAGLISLNSSPFGQSIIRNSVTYNSDGSATVTFNGAGTSYTISQKDIVKARESSVYATGDNDLIVFELATQQLRQDMLDGKINLEYAQFDNPNDPGENGNGVSDVLWGGNQAQIIYYLTGKTTESITQNKTSVLNALQKYYSSVQNGTAILSFGLDPNSSARTTEGELFKFESDRGYGHAFGVVGITDSTITIVNPWDSQTEITFTWDEFAKLNPRLRYTDLT